MSRIRKRMYVYWGLLGITVTIFIMSISLLLGRDDFIAKQCQTDKISLETVQNFDCVGWENFIILGVIFIVIFEIVGISYHKRKE